MHSLLKTISDKNDVIVCDYNYAKIKNIFKNHDMKFDDYVMFGHVCITSQFMPTTLLFGLVDNNKIQKSIDLEQVQVSTVDNGTLWRPVMFSGYKSLGMFYSPDNKKPKIKNIGVVRSDLIVPYDVSKNNLITYGNEFGLLIHNVDGGNTLWRSKFMKNPNKFKLSSHDGSLITKYDNKLSLKTPQPYLQNIQYTVQGELMMGDKCLSTNNSSDVYIDTCNGKINQKWFPYKNKFVSEKNKKCLTSNDSDVITSTCDSEFGRTSDNDNTNDLQEWNVQETDFYLNKPVVVPGKSVVLVDSNNPWYINKNVDRIPQKYKEHSVDDLGNHIDDVAKYKSRLKIDPHQMNLGYGYSYADSVPKKCNIENFNLSSDKSYYWKGPLLLFAFIVAIFIACMIYRMNVYTDASVYNDSGLELHELEK
jgi:hypothetical protein